jgi:hypothetical protein
MAKRFAHVPVEYLALPISPPAFKVLVAIQSFANRQGECHPYNSRIAELTNMNRKTVEKYVAELVKAGVLTATGRTSARRFAICTSLQVEGSASPQAEGSASSTSLQVEGSASPQVEGRHKNRPIEQTIREIYTPPTIEFREPEIAPEDRAAFAQIKQRWPLDCGCPEAVAARAKVNGRQLLAAYVDLDGKGTLPGKPPAYVVKAAANFLPDGSPKWPARPLEPRRTAAQQRNDELLASFGVVPGRGVSDGF